MKAADWLALLGLILVVVWIGANLVAITDRRGTMPGGPDGTYYPVGVDERITP